MTEYMRAALDEAEKAFDEDEVPVGAVIVKNGKIIAKAHNLTEKNHDATAHAEILAIREASKKLESWRLDGCTMYVTLEPCPMCAGAILNSRLSRVVFGAFDERLGSCFSKVDLLNGFYDTGVECIGSVLEQECKKLLSDYFALKR